MASERPRFRGRHCVAAILYGTMAIVSLVLGMVYWFRDSFMPYHAAALGKDWGELSPATQTLLGDTDRTVSIEPNRSDQHLR